MTAEQIKSMIQEVKTAFGIATDKEAMAFIEKIVLGASSKIEA